MPALNSSYFTQYLSIFIPGWTADIRDYIYRIIQLSAVVWGWNNGKAMTVNGRTLVMQIFVSIFMDLMPTFNSSYLTQYPSIFNPDCTADISDYIYRIIIISCEVKPKYVRSNGSWWQDTSHANFCLNLNEFKSLCLIHHISLNIQLLLTQVGLMTSRIIKKRKLAISCGVRQK